MESYIRATEAEHVGGGLSFKKFTKKAQAVFENKGLQFELAENGEPKNLIADVAKQVALEVEQAAQEGVDSRKEQLVSRGTARFTV